MVKLHFDSIEMVQHEVNLDLHNSNVGIEEIDEHCPTMLYFPADSHQMEACVKVVFPMPGQRFIYSTRSACPYILDSDGNEMFKDKAFEVGKDDLIREGKDGYVVAYGKTLNNTLTHAHAHAKKN